MQQRSIIKIAYIFIQILWFSSLFVCFVKTTRIINNPTDIRPPVNFLVKKAGAVTSDTTYTFEIPFAHGHVKYPANFTPSVTSMFVYHGTDILDLLLKLFVLYQIRLMVKQTLGGVSPFNLKNTQRLRWIGYTILLIGALAYVETFYSNYYFEGNLFLTPILEDSNNSYKAGYKAGRFFRYLTSSGNILTGLSALMLSVIFREGVLLKEEADLTI